MLGSPTIRQLPLLSPTLNVIILGHIYVLELQFYVAELALYNYFGLELNLTS